MLERITALRGARDEREGLVLAEDADFVLRLYSGAEKALERELEGLPAFGKAEKRDETLLMRFGAQDVLGLGPELETRLTHVTDLTSSRCRISISGSQARAFVQSLLPLDCSLAAFGRNAVALTGIHHMPVLVHARGNDSFHVYGLRSFAHSLWETLVDAAEGFA